MKYSFEVIEQINIKGYWCVSFGKKWLKTYVKNVV